MSKKKNKAFTLIEIVTVIAIILALVGIFGTVAPRAKKSARITQTKADIARLQTALAMYEADNGSYPATGDGNKTPLVTTLTGANYIEYKTSELNAGGELIDPWANTYHYVQTTYSFQIYSNGPNGVDDSGSSDDITSW